MNITRKAISVGLSAALLASLVATVAAPAAFASVTVTPANSNVSADTSVSGSQALIGPSIAEAAAGDIPVGYLTFDAPAGYAFDTTSSPAPSYTGGGTSFAMVFVNRTASTITYQVTAPSSAAGTVTFTNWKVKATAGTPLATPGNITLACGGSVPNGVTCGSVGTNFGTLTEVAGSTVEGPGKLKVTASTLTPAPGATISLGVQYVDQFGNPTADPHSSFLGVVWSQTSSGASGTFSNVTPFTVATGHATANFTVSAVVGQTYTLTANDLWTSSGSVGPITVTAPTPVPPAVPGTITVSKTVSVLRGGTTPTALGTYTFTEGSTGDWAANQWVQVCLAPATGAASSLSLAGGTVSGPGSLQPLSLSVSGNCFTVTIGASDSTRIEAFSVSGLTLTASSAAGPGTISATYTTNMDGNAVYFGGSTQTATGSLAASYGSGATALAVNMAANSPAFAAGSATIGGANPETVTISSVTTSGTCGSITLTSGQECLHVTATASSHAVGDAVSESVPAPLGTAPSPGAVIDALALTSAGTPQLMIGVTNQNPADVTLAEQTGSTGLLAAGTVITLKITTPGVLFSNAPTAAPSSSCPGFALVSNTGTLSLDRTSATFAVSAADGTGCLTSLVFDMQYDVAATVTSGGLVNLQVTAGSIPVVPASVANATLGAALFVTSNAPTIYINQNDQPIGNVTIQEKSAGALSAAANTNTFFVCLTTGEYFIRPPWAVVTSGNLLISTNSSLTAGSSSAAGTLITGPSPYGGDNCYAWAVYAASTTPSTITIEGVSATGTPTPTAHVNVPGWLAPGPTYLAIGTMASMSSTSGNLVDLATVAIRAFQSGITVTAATPVPFIAPGTTSGAASNLTIAETGNDLLQAGEYFTCRILPNATTETQQTYLQTAVSNGLPIVSTNGATTGLQAHLANWSNTSFTVQVDQAAVAGLGSITISNINYTTVSDAVTGPVIVECKSGSESPGQPFDAFVSNATVGSAPVLQKVVMTADSSLSASGPFSYATKLLKPGQSITIRVRSNPQLAGARLGVWIAIKGANGTWGPYKPHTSVSTDVNGTAYYTYTFGSKAWLAFRFYYGGDATHAPAWSYPSQFGRAI